MIRHLMLSGQQIWF